MGYKPDMWKILILITNIYGIVVILQLFWQRIHSISTKNIVSLKQFFPVCGYSGNCFPLQ